MILEVGEIFDGVVTGITKFGAFVKISEHRSGMVHISEISESYVREISDYLQVGQEVKVKLIAVTDDGKINLSIKKALPPRELQTPVMAQNSGPGADIDWPLKSGDEASFEDMISKFKSRSEEKISDLNRMMKAKRGISGKRGSR